MKKFLPLGLLALGIYLLSRKKNNDSQLKGIGAAIEIKGRKVFMGAGNVYNSIGLSNGKKQYYFTKVTGKNNYVSVRDATSVWGGLGIQFKNFEEAQTHYKSPLMKTMLLFAESELINSYGLN